MKKGSLVLLVLSSFFFTACKSKDRLPGNVLPREKMQAILWDMMRADQFLNSYVFSKDTAANKRKEEEIIYARILSIHKITWEEFKTSYYWYAQHPGILKPVMDSIAAPPKGAPPPGTIPPPAENIPVREPGPDTTIIRGKPVLPKDSVTKRRGIKPLRVE